MRANILITFLLLFFAQNISAQERSFLKILGVDYSNTKLSEHQTANELIDEDSPIKRFDILLSEPTRYGAKIFRIDNSQDNTTLSVNAGIANLTENSPLGLSVDLTW